MGGFLGGHTEAAAAWRDRRMPTLGIAMLLALGMSAARRDGHEGALILGSVTGGAASLEATNATGMASPSPW